MGIFYEQELTPLAVDCLSKANLFLKEHRRDKYLWMWVVIAVHHSLYTFCIACLYENCPDFATSKKRTATIGFEKALERVQENKYMRFRRKCTTRALQLTKEEENHIKELHTSWRNYFMHFRDDESESIIDRAYMANDVIPLVRSALRAIELLSQSGNVPFFRYDGYLKKKTESLLNSVLSSLEGATETNEH